VARQVSTGLAAAHERASSTGTSAGEPVPDERRPNQGPGLWPGATPWPAATGRGGSGRQHGGRYPSGSGARTVGYMSPEQVRGEVVDERTDLFSFGCVLYEMLTGSRAFKERSAVETMAAILSEDPLRRPPGGPDLPASLERLLRHCLDKVPERRFRSAHDLALASTRSRGRTALATRRPSSGARRNQGGGGAGPGGRGGPCVPDAARRRCAPSPAGNGPPGPGRGGSLVAWPCAPPPDRARQRSGRSDWWWPSPPLAAPTRTPSRRVG